jgi:hypothetical protein
MWTPGPVWTMLSSYRYSKPCRRKHSLVAITFELTRSSLFILLRRHSQMQHDSLGTHHACLNNVFLHNFCSTKLKWHYHLRDLVNGRVTWKLVLICSGLKLLRNWTIKELLGIYWRTFRFHEPCPAKILSASQQEFCSLQLVLEALHWWNLESEI